jgi:Ca2+-binding RTX toxin-like protein
VTVNLLNGATGGAAAGDTFVSIDSLRGSDFNDNLTGNAGWNNLEGGLGDDTLDGGAGINVVSYQHAAPGAGNLGVTVDLGIVGQQDTVRAGHDTLSNFQIIVGSAGNDTLTGNGNDNLWWVALVPTCITAVAESTGQKTSSRRPALPSVWLIPC